MCCDFFYYYYVIYILFILLNVNKFLIHLKTQDKSDKVYLKYLIRATILRRLPWENTNASLEYRYWTSWRSINIKGKVKKKLLKYLVFPNVIEDLDIHLGTIAPPEHSSKR